MKKEIKEKTISVGKALLLTVGVAGIIFVGAAMGNAVQILKYTPLFKKRKIKLRMCFTMPCCDLW